MPADSFARMLWNRPAAAQLARRGGLLGVLTGIALNLGVAAAPGVQAQGFAGTDTTAQPDAQPGGVAPKPPTVTTISKTCLPDHEKFCPNDTGGTRSDVACLRQHHASLHLTCRNLLRQVSHDGGAANAGP